MKLVKELGKGILSTVYLYEADNGEKIVIKKPNPGFSFQKSLLNYRKEANITQKLKKKIEYISVAQVSRNCGNWSVISSYIEGEHLTQKLLNSLPNFDQNKIANDLAEFLLTLHTLSVKKRDEKFSDLLFNEPHIFWYYSSAFCYALSCLKKTYFSMNSRRGNTFKRKKFIRSKEKTYKRYTFPQKYINCIEKTLISIEKFPTAFKFFGVCHNDLHPGNLLYNQKRKKLGIIDFCIAKYKGNIYEEFGILALNYDKNFTKKVVDRYNQLAKERFINISLDVDLIELFKIISAFKRIKDENSYQKCLKILDDFYFKI